MERFARQVKAHGMMASNAHTDATAEQLGIDLPGHDRVGFPLLQCRGSKLQRAVCRCVHAPWSVWYWLGFMPQYLEKTRRNVLELLKPTA